MNYKLKSFFYLIGFVAASVVYDQLQEEIPPVKETVTIESKEKTNNTIVRLES